MRKILVLALFLTCLTVGCSKKYDSVEEYAEAMNTVQKAQKSYTLEFENLSWISDTYYKAFLKNDLWKYSQSTNHGRNYIRTVLYDGNDITGYGEHSKWATLIASPETTEDKELHTRVHNIASQLLNWNKPSCLYTNKEDKPKFINNNAKMNGFDCRLIKYSDSYEVCVNDKLGIAVYLKTSLDEGKDSTINLLKVDTTELADSTFVLPENKQKTTLENMLKELAKGNF